MLRVNIEVLAGVDHHQLCITEDATKGTTNNMIELIRFIEKQLVESILHERMNGESGKLESEKPGYVDILRKDANHFISTKIRET